MLRFKREAGAIPARSRRCDGEMFHECHCPALMQRIALTYTEI